jgi:predicted phosphoadenosine phosphosulfate sulfurtransferase
MGRLPLNVCFVDQEAEWDMTIKHIREISKCPDIKLLWYQVPFSQTNSSSGIEDLFTCWDPKVDQWIRPKEEGSIKDIPGVLPSSEMKFWDLILNSLFGSKPAIFISGVRAEESPRRFMGLTYYACYKYITWGKRLHKKRDQYTFYPIYDWSYTDVWRAIYENKWSYCELYDYFYRYGVSTPNMRLSSLNHAVGIRSLFYLQELEPQNYNRLVARIPGIDSSGKANDDFFIKELPFMFADWHEYRNYLLDNLITDSLQREYFRQTFSTMDEKYAKAFGEELYKVQTQSIVTNDTSGLKLKAWMASYGKKEFDAEFRKAKRGKNG